jgi:NitT/TauT family transport system substrate-binding protein
MTRAIGRSVFAGVLLSALALAGSAQAQSKVAIAYIPGGDMLPAFVAQEQGYFKENGIEAELISVPLATNIPAAVVSGGAQIGMTTTSIMFQARENGIDLVAISGMSWDTRKNPQLSLIVGKNSGIRTAGDLVGKKIAFPGLKSLFDAAMMQWLKLKGVDPAKVTFIEARMPQLNDLLKSGNVDAIALVDPFRAKAVSDGIGVKLADYLVEAKDNQPLAYWATLRDYSRDHAADLKAFKAGIEEALLFIKDHGDEARQIGAKYLRGNILVDLPNWNTSLKPEDFKAQIDIEYAVGMLQRSPDIEAAFAK